MTTHISFFNKIIIMIIELKHAINHMFQSKIWDKSTEFTFLSSKFQKKNEVNFPQIL